MTPRGEFYLLKKPFVKGWKRRVLHCSVGTYKYVGLASLPWSCLTCISYSAPVHHLFVWTANLVRGARFSGTFMHIHAASRQTCAPFERTYIRRSGNTVVLRIYIVEAKKHRRRRKFCIESRKKSSALLGLTPFRLLDRGQ